MDKILSNLKNNFFDLEMYAKCPNLFRNMTNLNTLTNEVII